MAKKKTREELFDSKMARGVKKEIAKRTKTIRRRKGYPKYG